MLKVFLSREFYYVQALGYDVDDHAHICPQVSLAADQGSISCCGSEGAGIFLPGDCPHSITADSVFHTFLVNPVHPLARFLTRNEAKVTFFTPPRVTRQALDKIRFVPEEDETLQSILQALLNQIAGDDVVLEPLDHRIAEVVTYIDELEEKRVAAGQLAEQIALSESRFLHLFKNELQMTVRKYLQWKRTMDAAQKVVEGKSATEAAHAAGFTDSAHLARVFRQMFGITLTAAFATDPAPVLVMGTSQQRRLKQ